MGKNLGTKLAIIVAVMIFFIYGVIGPHTTEHKYSLKQAVAENIHLGLDLKGGIHLVLKVKVEDALNSATDRDVQRLEAALPGAGVAGATVRQDRSGASGDDHDRGHHREPAKRGTYDYGRNRLLGL